MKWVIFNIIFNINHLPFWFRRSPHGAFSEGIGDAIALATMSPTHLKRIGLLENYTSSRGYFYL